MGFPSPLHEFSHIDVLEQAPHLQRAVHTFVKIPVSEHHVKATFLVTSVKTPDDVQLLIEH
jgi:hypothetical protein